MNRPIRVGYLVMGLVFVGLAVIWLLTETEAIDGADRSFSAVLLGAGVVGLAASLIGSFGRKSEPMRMAAAEPELADATPESALDAEAEVQTATGTGEVPGDPANQV